MHESKKTNIPLDTEQVIVSNANVTNLITDIHAINQKDPAHVAFIEKEKRASKPKPNVYQIMYYLVSDIPELYRQHDASSIIETVLSLLNPRNELNLKGLFEQIYIKELTKLKPSGKKEFTTTESPFTPKIQLTINSESPVTISQLIEKYQSIEKLDSGASRQITYETHPTQKVIIIQLVRFVRELGKLNTIVIPDKTIYINTQCFKLEGCISHDGSLGGGHYVYTQFYEGVPRFRISDSMIEPIDNPGDALKAMCSHGYIYMYRRCPELSASPASSASSASPASLASSAGLASPAPKRKEVDESPQYQKLQKPTSDVMTDHNKYLKYKIKYLQYKKKLQQ